MMSNAAKDSDILATSLSNQSYIRPVLFSWTFSGGKKKKKDELVQKFN